MQSKAPTVEAYLETLTEDRRKAINAIRAVIHQNIDKTFQEGMQYGMIGYFVPHTVFPDGYHCDPKQPLPFAGLASQKNHISIYMMSMYGGSSEEKWFKAAWRKASDKKLDMGKCCIRFKKLEDMPLALIGEAFKRVKATKFIEHYLKNIRSSNKKASAKPVTKPKAAKAPVKERKDI